MSEHRKGIRNPGRRELRDSPRYLIVGKNLADQIFYPNPYLCPECKDTLSFRLVAKDIKLHDKCLWRVKAKQALMQAAKEAAGTFG